MKSFLPSLNNIGIICEICTNNTLYYIQFYRCLKILHLVVDTSVKIIENVYNYPQHLVLKLFRVLLSTEQCSFIGDFMKYKILDIIEEYIRTTTDLNVRIYRI